MPGPQQEPPWQRVDSNASTSALSKPWNGANNKQLGTSSTQWTDRSVPWVHQPCLLGEVAPRLCLHLRVRVLWLVHSSWDRPGKSQVQKTRSPAHHLQRTPQLSSCLLLKEVCQDRNKRRPGKGPKATFRPLRQTNRGMVLALNSFAHRPHDRRTAHYRKTSSHVDG